MEVRATAVTIPEGMAGDEAEGVQMASVRTTMIEALVSAGPASVRLRNTIAQSIQNGTMPCLTVGEYVDAGPSARQMFMTALWAFGKGTANELDALVASFLAQSAVRHATCAAAVEVVGRQVAGEDDRLESLFNRLSGLTFADALKGQLVSTRLSKSLSSSSMIHYQITEFLTGGEAIRAELKRQRNFGRKSLVELEALVRAEVVRRLSKHCSDPGILLDDCAHLFGTPETQRPELADYIHSVVAAKPPRDADLARLLEWAMPVLQEREIAILQRRYGFHSGQVETLEEVSETYSVTRERVRQIEAKALRKLAAKLDSNLLGETLARASEHFWDERTTPFLATHDSYQLRRELPPHLALALDLAGLSLGEWLGRTSVAMRHGFLAKSFDTAAVTALGEQLRLIASERRLPLALDDLWTDIDLSVLAAAVCVETELSLVDDYLFAQRPRARMRRIARLHRLLCASGRAMTLYELGDAYAAAYTDACSLRDLDIVLEIATHLFLEVEDGLWIAIGRGPRRTPSPPAEVMSRKPESVDPQTVAGSIQRALRERGPTSVGELYRDADTILEPGRSRNSVAPVLVGRPDVFLRVLPGVFALSEHRLDEAVLIDAPLPYLLNEKQARAYAFGRKAGEPWGTYRLWTPVAEYRLCGWARFDAPEALYHSLLSVASVDDWPVTSHVREDWRRLKEMEGRFEITLTGKATERELRPGLDRLLAACRIANERRALNWHSINRIMGRPLDAAGGQGLLALMVALGCLRVPDAAVENQLLLAHPTTEKAGDFAARLGAERMRGGSLEWDSVLGQEIASEALAAAPNAMGWVSLARLATLLKEGETDQESVTVVPDDEDDDDLFARLMREHRRNAEIASRDAAAAWLLEE